MKINVFSQGEVMKYIFLSVPSILFLLSPFLQDKVQAKVLETSYLTAKIPDHWDCHLANQQWVCRSQVKGYGSRVVASFVAKRASPEESIENFLTHFKSPKSIASKSGRSVVSKVVSVNKVTVNNVGWVQAVHFQGEVPNYYTYYMATVHKGVAVAIQFSSHKDVFKTMKPYFTRVVFSLRLKEMEDFPPVHAAPIAMGLPSSVQVTDSSSIAEEAHDSKAKMRSLTMIIVFVVITALFLVILFSRKKKG